MKFILKYLLFSFFLNISHDLLIAEKLDGCDSCRTAIIMAEVNVADELNCDELSKYHALFHFSAILVALEMHFSQIEKQPYFFTLLTPLSKIKETSFKPPIA